MKDDWDGQIFEDVIRFHDTGPAAPDAPAKIPRIISAAVKRPNSQQNYPLIKISGELRITIGRTIRSPRYGEVRAGYLFLYKIHKDGRRTFDYGISLQNLSLNLDSKYYKQFSLCRFDQHVPLAIIQVIDADLYRKWLKVLQAEIITQQKPAEKALEFPKANGDAFQFEDNEEDVDGRRCSTLPRKFLVARKKSFDRKPPRNDDNNNECSSSDKENRDCPLRKAKSVSPVPAAVPAGAGDRNDRGMPPDSLVRLANRCQKEFVSVKEKKMLFESLNRFSISVDNLLKCHEDFACKGRGRYHSLRNLDEISVSTPVREIKAYFENYCKKK